MAISQVGSASVSNISQSANRGQDPVSSIQRPETRIGFYDTSSMIFLEVYLPVSARASIGRKDRAFDFFVISSFTIIRQNTINISLKGMSAFFAKGIHIFILGICIGHRASK